MFKHARNADAPEFPSSRRLPLALTETCVVGKLESPVDDSGKVATVVDVADRRLERHRRWGNKVFLAQSYRILADKARSFLHHALERVVCFRPSGPAIGRDRHLVGKIAGDRKINFRDTIHAG